MQEVNALEVTADQHIALNGRRTYAAAKGPRRLAASTWNWLRRLLAPAGKTVNQHDAALPKEDGLAILGRYYLGAYERANAAQPITSVKNFARSGDRHR